MLVRQVDLIPEEEALLLQLRDQTIASMPPDGSVPSHEGFREIGMRIRQVHEAIAASHGLDWTKCAFMVEAMTRTARIAYPLTTEEEAAARGLG